MNERLNQINKTEQLNDWNKNNENLGYRNGELGYEQENDKEKN